MLCQADLDIIEDAEGARQTPPSIRAMFSCPLKTCRAPEMACGFAETVLDELTYLADQRVKVILAMSSLSQQEHHLLHQASILDKRVRVRSPLRYSI